MTLDRVGSQVAREPRIDLGSHCPVPRRKATGETRRRLSVESERLAYTEHQGDPGRRVPVSAFQA